MATKKPTLHDKSVEELTKLLAERREDLRKLRFTSAGSRNKDTNESAKTRKDIARMLPIISEKNNA